MPRPRLPEPPVKEFAVYLSWPEVHQRTSLSRSTIWRLEHQGQFPRRVFISPGRVAWRERDIEDWMKHREQHRAAYVD